MLLSDFDHIRIINLPERADRRRLMRQQLDAAGIKGEFFPAIRPTEQGVFTSRGMLGSFLSHASVVSEAARMGGSLLILEDDCNFLPGARDYQIPPCDVFYGSHAEDADEMIGAHCMGFSPKAVRLLDAYLVDYVTPEFKGDPKAVLDPSYDPAVRPPIDGAYVWFRRAHPELTTHFAMLTYQRPSRSDCTPGTLDKIPIVRELVEIARGFRQ